MLDAQCLLFALASKPERVKRLKKANGFIIV
ncbi:hypothetical protein N749_07670 [Legionella pneumophila str. Leg01/20]|nr:hypothetical protein N749_07670 [Legionella pneumophila str. Leg01/20]